MDENEDIKVRIEKILTEARDYAGQYCGGNIYLGDGMDTGFTRFIVGDDVLPDVISQTNGSRLLLCKDSPRMESCVGEYKVATSTIKTFTFTKNKSLSQGRELFEGGVIAYGTTTPLKISCFSTEGDKYTFDIPKIRVSYPQASSTDMCDK